MFRYRSLLSLVLALVATFLVSCGSPSAKQPPTYTQAQLSQIEIYVPRLTQMRDRLPELQAAISRESWFNVDNFIHGPLGELRQSLTRVSRNLLPADQKVANSLIDEVFQNLEDLDRAALDNNYQEAVVGYNALVKNLDAFLDLVPQG